MGTDKIDPRTKLFLFVLTGAFVMGITAALPCLLLCGFVAALLFYCGQRGMAVKGMLVYFFCVFIMPPVCRRIPGAAGTLIMSLTLLVRLFTPIVMALALIFKTTTISQFMAALQKMHVPNQIIIPIAIMFRFIPTVQEEWQSIQKAMAFRGMAFRVRTTLRHPLQTLENVLIPLLISAVSIMDELAAASLARGLDSENKRGSLLVVKMKAVDYLLIVMSLMFAAFLLRFGMGGAAWSI